MNTRTGLLTMASACLATAGIVLLGISVTSQGAPAAQRPLPTPSATVAPDVAAEMNGDPDDVDMAGDIQMHPMEPVDEEGLLDDGQGTGCLRNYGDPGQCLPLLSLSQQAMPEMDHPWTCVEVRELFPHGISVHGRDTLGLDTNRDRTLCGPGDG